MRNDPTDARGTTYDDRAHGAYDPDDVRAPAWEDAVAAAAPGALVAPDAPLASDDVTGNLRRYARWQWRDFWERRGFWMAGAALLGVWWLAYVVANSRGARGPMSPEEARDTAVVMFTFGGLMASLLGTGGLVARERERGLQRFLFAKPVRIARYYLQGLAVNSVGSAVVIAGAVLLAALVLPAGLPVLTVIGAALAAYAVGSGVTFLLSTLLRYDAALAFGWVMAGIPVTVLARQGGPWPWMKSLAEPLQWFFPQGWVVGAVDAVFGRTPTGATASFVALAALVAVLYGLLCAAAGAAVLRRRSIST